MTPDAPSLAGIKHGASLRLAVVLSHPTQYYSPWFAELARVPNLCLRVFYLWDFGLRPQRDPRFGTTFAWDVDLQSGYDWELVPNRSPEPGTEHFGGLDNPTLFARVRNWRPDAVLLYGYAYRSHLRFILNCRLTRIPLIFRGDSHLLGRASLPLIRRLLGRLLFAQFAGFAAVGEANRRYFLAHGVSNNRIQFCPHSVDARRFDPARPEVREAASRLRASLGLPPGARVLLYSGKFQSEKDPLGLLAAFQRTRPPGLHLIFAGDGPQRPEIESACAVDPSLRLLPFANQSEMPARYLAADAFCLPSCGLHETWGLSVNEAMHMGLPCLVSDRVGCQLDLVEDGQNGWVFPAGDSNALGNCLQRVTTAELAPLSDAARRRVARYTYADSTRGLLQLLFTLRLRVFRDSSLSAN